LLCRLGPNISLPLKRLLTKTRVGHKGAKSAKRGLNQIKKKRVDGKKNSFCIREKGTKGAGVAAILGVP